MMSNSNSCRYYLCIIQCSSTTSHTYKRLYKSLLLICKERLPHFFDDSFYNLHDDCVVNSEHIIRLYNVYKTILKLSQECRHETNGLREKSTLTYTEKIYFCFFKNEIEFSH